MNDDCEHEPAEPPGPGPWTIEFHLDQLDSTHESDTITSNDDAPADWDGRCQKLAKDHGIDLNLLRRGIQTTLNSHDVDSAEVSVAITSGPAMRQWNRQYLNHDFDTDVLSFCLSDPDSRHLLAQLIVSWDYANKQARSLSQRASQVVSANQELCLYVVHGILHTLGYDDHSDAERQQMRDAEREVLEQLGWIPYWPAEVAATDHCTPADNDGRETADE